MKSTREVATEIVSMLREYEGDNSCISFYYFKDCAVHTEEIASVLDAFLAEGGGICS